MAYDTPLGDASTSRIPARQLLTARSLLQILKLVHTRELVSRSELSYETGISRSTIGEHVDRLIQAGLIVEGPEGGVTGGRRSRLLALNREWGCLAGISMGATGTEVCITDVSNTIIDSQRLDMPIELGPHQVLKEVSETISQMTEKAALPLMGVGVGAPGPVNARAGWVEAPPIMPGWDRFPIVDWLRRRLQCPVYLDNDVNIMALGERTLRRARPDSFVFVKIATGIGAGLIISGKLHRGFSGCAGDIGHIPVTNEAVPCSCGRFGCLEAMASGAAIARLAQEVAVQQNASLLTETFDRQGTLTAADVGHAATCGDSEALNIVHGAARYLGQALASVVNILNPSLLVLGGGVIKMGDFYLAAVREYVYKRSLPLATRDLKIERSVDNEQVGMVGASTLVTESLIDLDYLANNVV